MKETTFGMFTIITRDDCPWCTKAKSLLKANDYAYKEIHIPSSLSREEFLKLVEHHDTTKTVPKIFFGNRLIGGYEELADWIDNHSGGFGEGQL